MFTKFKAKSCQILSTLRRFVSALSASKHSHSIQFGPPNSGRDRKKLYLYARNASNTTQRLLFAGWLILGLPHTHPEFDRKMLKSSPTYPQPPQGNHIPFHTQSKALCHRGKSWGKAKNLRQPTKGPKSTQTNQLAKGGGKLFSTPFFMFLLVCRFDYAELQVELRKVLYVGIFSFPCVTCKVFCHTRQKPPDRYLRGSSFLERRDVVLRRRTGAYFKAVTAGEKLIYLANHLKSLSPLLS